MTRARRGLTVEEVRQLWLPRAEAKTKAIMDSYYASRDSSGGGYGHEGLGVYGTYQERAAREKVRLAAKLLRQANIEVTYSTIHKVTGQSRSTIMTYWAPPRQGPPEDATLEVDNEPPRIIRFPGRPET